MDKNSVCLQMLVFLLSFIAIGCGFRLSETKQGARSAIYRDKGSNCQISEVHGQEFVKIRARTAKFLRLTVRSI